MAWLDINCWDLEMIWMFREWLSRLDWLNVIYEAILGRWCEEGGCVVFICVPWLCMSILRMFGLMVVLVILTWKCLTHVVIMINFGIWVWKWLCMGCVCAYLRLACIDFRAVIYENKCEIARGWNEVLEFKTMRLLWELSRSSLDRVKLRSGIEKGKCGSDVQFRCFIDCNGR